LFVLVGCRQLREETRDLIVSSTVLPAAPLYPDRSPPMRAPGLLPYPFPALALPFFGFVCFRCFRRSGILRFPAWPLGGSVLFVTLPELNRRQVFDASVAAEISNTSLTAPIVSAIVQVRLNCG
jgi:hypothetical protein